MGYNNIFDEYIVAGIVVMCLIPAIVLAMGWFFRKKIEKKILYFIVGTLILFVLFYGLHVVPVHMLLGMFIAELILPKTDLAPVVSAIMLFIELILAQYIFTRVWVTKPNKNLTEYHPPFRNPTQIKD